jgi:Domain of unknown function (DUF4258)
MIDRKRPVRSANLLAEIKNCIESGKYILTKHALDRQKERSINLTETLYILRNGKEEKQKTRFDKDQNVWKYAIEGKTLIEQINARVIVAFDENSMLIITVMKVGDV